jgi:endonuclease/exonuclease/phosphatase family metal-dependent hydrolase
VAALQEVDRHWSARSALADQTAELSRRLHMHGVYGANLDLDPLVPGAPRRQYGTAILSRFPILDWRNTLLPRPAGGEQRGLLEAVLQIRGVRVRVANTHLQHNSALERTAQAQRIAELLAPSPEPVVLAGDLNAVPEAPELAPLLGAFADAWTRAGDGPGFTIPVEAPNRRIDYVLTSPEIEARSAHVIATTASDHLPVVADLAVPKR